MLPIFWERGRVKAKKFFVDLLFEYQLFERDYFPAFVSKRHDFQIGLQNFGEGAHPVTFATLRQTDRHTHTHTHRQTYLKFLFKG